MKTLELNPAWCKGCGVCVEFCPKNALKLAGGRVHTVPGADCIACGLCESLCPDFAVYLVEREGERVG